MEKVKLTQEQADAIKKRDFSKEINRFNFLHCYITGGWDGKTSRCLNSLNIEELARAVYIGYEVEPEFKAGDWVITGRGVLGKYQGKSNGVYEFVLVGGHHATSDNLRRATPEEIAEEKERRWWAKHGRDVWEVKQGDVLMATRRQIFEVTADPKSHEFGFYTGNDEYDFDIEECKDENWKVICFCDDRKDV